MGGYTIHSNPTFEADVARLAKKYPHVTADIEQALKRIQESSPPGIPIPGGKGKLFKLRVGSTDLRRGKSGGFRVISYLQSPTDLWPLTCFFKGERSDVPIMDLVDKARKLGLEI